MRSVTSCVCLHVAPHSGFLRIMLQFSILAMLQPAVKTRVCSHAVSIMPLRKRKTERWGQGTNMTLHTAASPQPPSKHLHACSPAVGLSVYYELSYGWVGIAVPGILWFVGAAALMFVPQVINICNLQNCIPLHVSSLACH